MKTFNTEVPAEWVNGLPPVGAECEIKHKNATPDWAQPDFHKTKIIAYGNELVIFHNESTCNGKHESVGSISDYLFRKPETEAEKVVRERLENGKAYYQLMSDIETSVMNPEDSGYPNEWDELRDDWQEVYMRQAEALGYTKGDSNGYEI